MFEFCEMMPHRHCLEDSAILMWGFTISNLITVFEYSVIAFCFWRVSLWGTAKGHWRGLNNAIALVFVFCSFNYIMQSVVIWHGCYYTQLIVTSLGVLVSLKAVYHLIKIGRTSLGALVLAARTTIKSMEF